MSTQPAAIALPGMPKYLADFSSWANVMPPSPLMACKPERAIAAGAGENDANGPVLLVVGQGAEKEIHRHVRGVGLARQETKVASRDDDVHIRRHDMDVIGLDAHPVGGLLQRQTGRAGQQFTQLAFMLGVQMLDQHKSHAALFGQLAKQLDKGLVAARGSANADDGKCFLPGRAIVRLMIGFGDGLPPWGNRNGSAAARRVFPPAGILFWLLKGKSFLWHDGFRFGGVMMKTARSFRP